jgi:polyphosphate kinase
MKERVKINSVIEKSRLISRDLSWLQFNYRVLDQAIDPGRNIFEKLKFLAITASNLDEFFMIRVGSLYNYLDYKKNESIFPAYARGHSEKNFLPIPRHFTETRHLYFSMTFSQSLKRMDLHS